VVDNYFTGRKRNIEQWLGHENFEMLHHDIGRQNARYFNNVVDPGSGAFLTSGSGMGNKKSRSGSGILIWNERPGSYFRELRNNFLG
jgi:hypothetical protein